MAFLLLSPGKDADRRLDLRSRRRRGSWSPAGSASAAGRPEGEKRSVTELEAEEVGASVKWATANVERAGERGNGERSSGHQRQAERGDFNDPPPTC